MNVGRLAASAGVGDVDLVAPGLEPEERLGAQEAEPADLLAADDALEQERRGRPLDLPEGGDRRQAVAGQLAVDRDARGLAGPAEEFLERGAMAGSWDRVPGAGVTGGPDGSRWHVTSGRRAGPSGKPAGSRPHAGDRPAPSLPEPSESSRLTDCGRRRGRAGGGARVA